MESSLTSKTVSSVLPHYQTLSVLSQYQTHPLSSQYQTQSPSSQYHPQPSSFHYQTLPFLLLAPPSSKNQAQSKYGTVSLRSAMALRYSGYSSRYFCLTVACHCIAQRFCLV